MVLGKAVMILFGCAGLKPLKINQPAFAAL